MRTLAILLMWCAWLVTTPAPAAAQVRLAPIVGATLLERRDTSLTHGSLRDEVTLGRSWLTGAAVDFGFGGSDSVAIELVYGPYHGDVDRYCIVRFPPGTCEIEPGRRVSRVVQAGMQYAHAFGRRRWRPYAGGGFGLKRVAFDDAYASPKTMPVVAGAFGVESDARTPVRIEARALFVWGHPFLEERNHVELQARVSVLLFGRR